MYNYVETPEKIWIKQSALLLVAVLTLNSLAFPQSTRLPKASRTVQVKGDVQRRGMGEKSRVKVKLLSNAEVKGYISKIEDSSFGVTDQKTRQLTTIAYADVEKIQGPGLPTIAKVGIVVGAAVLIVALVIGIGLKRAGY
ncbi:MAG: hypothetical protein ABJA69_03310 [Acidobacteriaceae bacterium]